MRLVWDSLPLKVHGSTMMTVDQCRVKAAAAHEAADAASRAELRDAWRAIADEWEMIGALAELQRALVRPGAVAGLH